MQSFAPSPAKTTGKFLPVNRGGSSVIFIAASSVKRESAPARQEKSAVYTCSQRASIAAHTVQSPPVCPKAITSSVERGIQGLSCGKAKPFIAATPIRTPVKEPGPLVTAKASISSSARFAFFKRPCTSGSSVWLCVRPVFKKASPNSFPSSAIATLAAQAEDSSARIFMQIHRLFQL